MIAKNEGKTIRRALESALPFVDEYVIGIDNTSTDNTELEISRFLNKNDVDARIYWFDWQDDFSKARNECADKAIYDFIIHLDGHEYIESGKEEISKIKQDANGCDVFNMYIHNYADGLETMFPAPRIYHKKYKHFNKSHNVIVFDESLQLKTVIGHKRDDDLMMERQHQRVQINIPDLLERIDEGDKRAKAQIIQEYMSQQDWGKSITAIKDYLTEEMENKERYQVYIKLAMCYFHSKLSIGCNNALLLAEKYNDDVRNAHLVMLGMLNKKLGFYDDARYYLTMALKVKRPEHFWFLYPQFYYETPNKILGSLNDNNKFTSDNQAKN